MNLKNRIKFITGITVVLTLVGLMVLYLNHSMSMLRTSRAQLKSDTITVGTDYAGLIDRQYVEEGDKIVKGQKLFVINSQPLKQDLSNSRITTTELPFSLDEDQNIIVEAKEDGVIQKIFYRTGSYAPVGSILANIDTVSSLYVEARYELAPPYYARIHKGDRMTVTLPDNTKISAMVYNISLVGRDESVDTVIKARLDSADLADFRFAVGTPVESTLKLSSQTWYEGLTESVRKLFKPKGF